MNLRSRLTYANVAATLALCIAIGGGTVYAANELDKNSVKSKNIAKGAVKTSDLGRQAVTGPKVKDGTIEAGDIAAGVIPQLRANVTGQATAGPQGGLTTTTEVPLALNGTTSFTPADGEVAALVAEARWTVASTSAAQYCQPTVRLSVNGEPMVYVNTDGSTNNTTPAQFFGRDADGPFGLLNPGTPLNITADLSGDTDCTAGSQLDKLDVSIVQIR
jgi:hypothetical protein